MRTTLAAVVTVGTLLGLTAAAAPSASAFALGVHEELTSEALSFLSPAVLADIRDEHAYEDTVHQFETAHHFEAVVPAERLDDPSHLPVTNEQ